MMELQKGLSPVIFLDTNALHFTRLYLEAAEEHGLPPFGNKGIDVGLGDQMGERTKKNIKKGYKTIAYLQAKSIDEARVIFPPIVALEVACGILRSKAILSAADEGIPSRWWNRFDEVEILSRLRKDHYDAVEGVFENLKEGFERAGISFLQMDNKKMSDVWKIARSLLRCVYLSVNDCILFSSALVEMADEIISFDDYLSGIINKVKDPSGDAFYEGAKCEIVEVISRCIDIPVEEIRLPATSRLPKDLQMKPLTPEAT